MIQRIQSLWLFIAAVISSLLLLDGYTGYIYQAEVPRGFELVVHHLTVTGHFGSLLLAAALVILPLVTIFMFKDRKRQRWMAIVSIGVALAFLGVALLRIQNFAGTTPTPRNGQYELAAILPAAVIIFLILAWRGISKDEKLVRSMDRLR